MTRELDEAALNRGRRLTPSRPDCLVISRDEESKSLDYDVHSAGENIAPRLRVSSAAPRKVNCDRAMNIHVPRDKKSPSFSPRMRARRETRRYFSRLKSSSSQPLRPSRASGLLSSRDNFSASVSIPSRLRACINHIRSRAAVRPQKRALLYARVARAR